MNGLKLIRKQCNFTLSDFAARIGVSRQMVSMWETGKREIPAARKRQISEFMGIEEQYLGELSEAQKKALLGKAMFQYIENGVETYRYKPCEDDEHIDVKFFTERPFSIDEEYALKQRQQKELLDQINQTITGPAQENIRDQMTFIYRGTEVFERINEAFELCFQQKPMEKMKYYYLLLTIAEAVCQAFGRSPKEFHAVDPDILQDFKEFIEKYLQRKVTYSNAVPAEVEFFDGNWPPENFDQLTLSEKIHLLEEEYARVGVPEGTLGVGIRIS